jgi:hypothetical protein
MRSDDGDTYRFPDKLEPTLEQVRTYWSGLKRGGNAIPFWDDLKISMKTPAGREVFLMEAFENPLRFRFDLVGDDITRHYGTAVNGKFSDEIDLHAPLAALTTQCRVTIERREPTYFRYAAGRNAAEGGAYSRLVLPLWGNGRIEMLLGAVDLPDDALLSGCQEPAK